MQEMPRPYPEYMQIIRRGSAHTGIHASFPPEKGVIPASGMYHMAVSVGICSMLFATPGTKML
jgi:hypothetical protein